MKNIKNIIISSLLVGAAFGGGMALQKITVTPEVTAQALSFDEQDATIQAIKKVSPSVVNIILLEEVDRIKTDANGNDTVTKEVEQVGKGTGFIISSDGYILTSRHVINTANRNRAQYQIFLNNGKQYYAQFIGNDPLKDLAILKIFDKDLPYVEMGDSSTLAPGMTVIAIGNSLGIYKNSATKGIVSALGRDLSASDSSGQNTENFDNLIQTDAEINLGNSGGPLITLEGKVVGVNSAIDQNGASIGFAIPINDARTIVDSITEFDRIARPRLGIRYVMLTPEIVEKDKLPRSDGAWIRSNADGEPGVLPDSPASRGGLLENDIIFEVNAIPINDTNKLFNIIQNYKPGARIGLKILRGDKVIIRIVTLDEYTE